MTRVITIKFDSSCFIDENILHTSNLVAKLNIFLMNIDEYFLVQSYIYTQFLNVPFQMNYNNIKDK